MGHPTQAHTHVSAAPVPIQLPGKDLGKAMEDDPSVWAPTTHTEDTEDALGSSFVSTLRWPLQPSGESINLQKIFLSLPLPLTWTFK